MINPGVDVVIVDFSFPPDELKKMATVANSILVLDHHQTAEEQLAEFPSAGSSFEEYIKLRKLGGKIHVLFDMKRSGAGIAWDFFYPSVERPRLIDLIEDRDIWGKKYPESDPLFEVLSLSDYTRDIFNDLLSDKKLDTMVKKGTIYRELKLRQIKQMITESARIVKCCGYDVPVMMCPLGYTSDTGAELAKNHPFAILYWDMADGKRKLSFRSREDGVDVAEIAKRFGGGGHAVSSGAIVESGDMAITDHPDLWK